MIEVRLVADPGNNEYEAVVKLLAAPRKGELLEIEHDTGRSCLEVVEEPIHTPAMGMRDPEITVIVDLRCAGPGQLEEVMKCADDLRTQDGPR